MAVNTLRAVNLGPLQSEKRKVAQQPAGPGPALTPLLSSTLSDRSILSEASDLASQASTADLHANGSSCGLPGGMFRDAKDAVAGFMESLAGEVAGFTDKVAAQFGTAPPAVCLDATAPSFAEQRGTKPIFYDRHGTFHNLTHHLMGSRGSGNLNDGSPSAAEAEAQQVADGAAAAAVAGALATDAAADAASASAAAAASTAFTAAAAELTVAAVASAVVDAPAPAAAGASTSGAVAANFDLTPFLPSWSIAKSHVWALAEEGLLRAMQAEAAARVHLRAALEPHMPGIAEDAEDDDPANPTPTNLTRPTTNPGAAGVAAAAAAAGAGAEARAGSGAGAEAAATALAFSTVTPATTPADAAFSPERLAFARLPTGPRMSSNPASPNASYEAYSPAYPGSSIHTPSSLIHTPSSSIHTPSSMQQSFSARFPARRMSRFERCRSMDRSEGGAGSPLAIPATPRGLAGSHGLSRTTSFKSVATSLASMIVPGSTADTVNHARADLMHHLAYAAGVAAAGAAGSAMGAVGDVAVGAVTAAASSAAALAHVGVQGALELGAGTAADLSIGRIQSILVKRATHAAADHVLGPGAPEHAREALQHRLRATLCGASILFFLLNTHSMTDTLMHINWHDDLATTAKMVLQMLKDGPQAVENALELMEMGAAAMLGVAQRTQQ
ncbi:hypothetical protein HYH03_017884 [Edaphochlamys debaryana]|uniref:Uncharacterized protein n=1 Tax=Edaphochlamys debaryana TaxID=47281 RepID=A0A835XEU7_9CHLO|nr:hypothetical protein HYH03_017884 [Edaphochlamys debaryana]|eukprot:KAG2483227.1 hypothetical protein HYH03_017884 [Edaphochlamys debaryana]